MSCPAPYRTPVALAFHLETATSFPSLETLIHTEIHHHKEAFRWAKNPGLQNFKVNILTGDTDL